MRLSKWIGPRGKRKTEVIEVNRRNYFKSRVSQKASKNNSGKPILIFVSSALAFLEQSFLFMSQTGHCAFRLSAKG